MTELEQRVRSYADAVLEDVAPVTADEVRGEKAPAAGSTMMTRLLGVAAVVLALLGVGAALTVGDDEGMTNVATGPSSFPITLDGHRDWNLALLNGEIRPSDEEVEARYSESFVRAVPPEELRSTSEPLVAMAPWRIVAEVERRGDQVLAVQLVSKGGDQARLTIHRDADGLVDGSTILTAVPCAEAVAGDTRIEGPLSDRFAWAIELLRETTEPSDEELQEQFSPSFLSEIPPARLRSGLPQLRALAPYTLRSLEGPPTATSLTARVGIRTGEEARLTLSIEPAAPHRITGFAVRTQPPCQLPVPGS